MSYASWRKCDFQIHTPRDPGWKGDRPVGIGDDIAGGYATETDVQKGRDLWATGFVNKCLDEGLEAIAITDHHELVMVPYVQQEIANRIDSGKECDLWLFPGMELTAHGGVQALIIFDANLEEEWWQQIQGKLGIEYASTDKYNSTGSPRVKQLTYNYADIAGELDTIKGIRGKYIILPNISQGGKHTVLTDGAHADFKRMPYVGGYLDRGQTIENMSSKNRQRISGKDKTWSSRRVYPLPTSDSRESAYTNLGSNNTWIKLAEPTAEAIRQAFLAHESRITIESPIRPSIWISNVTIENSNILQPTNIRLSPELNSIIGGRGSGKSSFLEYLSFGIGRSSYDIPRDHYSGTDRFHGLINDSLISQGGSVAITLIQDDATFIITRDRSTDYQPRIAYPNGNNQSASLNDLRSLFPAVVYSQGELAEIGKRTQTKTKLTDLLQLVGPDYKREDDSLLQDIESKKESVRSSLKLLTDTWSIQDKKHKLTTKRDSIIQRVAALEKTLPKQSEEDQAVLKKFEEASAFESKRIQASKQSERLMKGIEKLKEEFSSPLDVSNKLGDISNQFTESYKKLITGFISGIEKLSLVASANKAEMEKSEKTWKTGYESICNMRDDVLAKLGEHRTVTAQIIDLKKQAETITNEIGDLNATAPNVDREVSDNIEKLKIASEVRSEKVSEWAKKIENLSAGKIKVEVSKDGDISDVYEALDLITAKTGSQEPIRQREVNNYIKNSSVWDLIYKLHADCTSILYWSVHGNSIGNEIPKYTTLLNIVGGTEKIKTSLLELMDVHRLAAISTAFPKPEISLFYCDGDKKISFDKASEGQRSAALLFVLLEQEGGPLIVDQPEGDLDNKIISDITNKLHEAKSKRQIIFTSHNANIVVNGASELVSYIGVDEDGNRSFESSGAIDEPTICNHITTTMEGGEKAFRDRKDKYGY